MKAVNGRQSFEKANTCNVLFWYPLFIISPEVLNLLLVKSFDFFRNMECKDDKQHGYTVILPLYFFCKMGISLSFETKPFKNSILLKNRISSRGAYSVLQKSIFFS